ncbi:unnamed protein product [Meloidogyne enterolobii]|uniref:Uncharacterized protein n=1 Tax=Meloidogyne enterolobii TaxID=390850 RepID=A0ACB0XWX4_MELEN
MFKKFNGIVILFFILKIYSEGAPKKKKAIAESIGDTSVYQPEIPANYYGQPNQGYEVGGSSSALTGTLATIGNHSCEWEGCGHVFDNADTLLEHVYNEHIGMEEV